MWKKKKGENITPFQKLLIELSKKLNYSQKTQMINDFRIKYKGNPKLDEMTNELKKAINYDDATAKTQKR